MAVIIRNSEETLVTNEKPEKKHDHYFFTIQISIKIQQAPLKCKTKGINNRSLQLKSGSKKS
jgi:hypothetical protein